jgi:hypothetical protein
VLDPLATLKLASAGFDPSDVIEVAVKPTGFRFSPVIVITETPDACLRKTALRASDGWLSIEKFMDSPRVRQQGYLGLNSAVRLASAAALQSNWRDTPINDIICILQAKTTRYRGWLA